MFSHQTGALRNAGKRGVAPFTLALLSAMSFSSVGSQAQTTADARNYIKKMEALFANAKSYSGVITIKQSGNDAKTGKPYTTTTIQQIKFKAPNMILVDIKLSGTGPAASVGQNSQSVYSNGKTVSVYRPAIKQYMQQPAPPKLALMDLFKAIMPNPEIPGVAFGGTQSVGGRAAYLIKIKPMPPKDLPPNLTAVQKAQLQKMIATAKTAELSIDKQSFYPLRLTGGQQGLSREVIFGSQSFNGAIADSAFNFTPPAGVKLATPPPGGGGAPGVPR